MYTFLLLFALNVAGLFIIYFLVRREIKRIVNPKDVLREIEADVQSVLTELNSATERDVTIIEEATERLKKLVEEADKRIRVLEKTGTKRKTEEYTSLKPPVIPIQKKDPVPEEKADMPEKSDREKVIGLYRQGFDASIIAKRLELPLGEVELIISIGSI